MTSPMALRAPLSSRPLPVPARQQRHQAHSAARQRLTVVAASGGPTERRSWSLGKFVSTFMFFQDPIRLEVSKALLQRVQGRQAFLAACAVERGILCYVTQSSA